MAEIETKMIEFPSNGHSTPGYMAVPQVVEAASEHCPGLVLIQEWWGLVPHIKDVVERFARQGFVALAPDLFHGRVPGEPDEARKLAMELDRERAVKEIVAGVHFLQGLEMVSPKMIGVVGWCMGGMLAVTTAAVSADVGAVVAFYGSPRDLSIVKDIRAPLLGLYGEHDHGLPPEFVSAFEAELQKQGVPHEVHIYPNAGHAFFNDTRPEAYNTEAAQNAWLRTLDWLRKYLVERR